MAYDITTPAAQMLMGDLNDMPSLEDVFFVKGKVAIVTGGSSGLGFNVTARLLQGGANVVMASFNPAEENNACGVLEAKGFGPDRVRFFQANVTDEDDLEALIKFTDETFGSIDILVTCAAVWSYAQIYNLPKAEFEKAVGVNLTGTFLTVKHVSKYMIDHELCSLRSVQGRRRLPDHRSGQGTQTLWHPRQHRRSRRHGHGRRHQEPRH